MNTVHYRPVGQPNGPRRLLRVTQKPNWKNYYRVRGFSEQRIRHARPSVEAADLRMLRMGFTRVNGSSLRGEPTVQPPRPWRPGKPRTNRAVRRMHVERKAA